MIVCKNCGCKIVNRGLWEMHALKCDGPNKSLIGTKVRRGNSVRTIVSVYSDIPGGVRLDKPIEGFKSWNLEELEKE